MTRTLLLATRNRGKLEEFRALLEPLGFDVLGMDDVEPMPEVVEDGETFEANARKKAEFVRDRLDTWVVADDSGLVVDLLEGAPGVHSARYAGEHGDDAANNRKLLLAMDGVEMERRGARFVAVLALARPQRETLCFEGRIEGRIGTVPRGSGGFGYDVLFLPEGMDRTTAELSMEEKSAISHRGKATRALVAHLRSELDVEKA